MKLTVLGHGGEPPAHNDVVKVEAPEQNGFVQILGTVDLGRNNYVSIIPREFTTSLLTMSQDLKTVTAELDGGTVGALYQGTGTMTWRGYDSIRDAVGTTASPAPAVTEGAAGRSRVLTKE